MVDVSQGGWRSTHHGWLQRRVVDLVHFAPRPNAVIDAFDSVNSGVQILAVGLNLAPFGIDLHLQCSYGVFLNYHWNAGTIMQSIGRLIRPGQQKSVIWLMLRVVDSFYDVAERPSPSGHRSSAWRRAVAEDSSETRSCSFALTS